MQFDYCIIGSGFSGSLLAWILARSGQSVCIVDRSQHPRFAIGESSTPLADILLQQISAEFDLPELLPLSRWGSWQSQLPELRAGKKRGFSYFFHQPDHPFSETSQHEASLLVAASADDHLSDSHWMRSDVDAWLWQQAGAAGAERIENFADASLVETSSGWQINGYACDEPIQLKCNFLVDASGGGGLLASSLKLDRLDHRLRTKTGALFGHFQNVGSMSQWLNDHGLSTQDDPFNADDAAQHHLLADGGWLWMLRFSEGTTSIGIVQTTNAWLAVENTDARAENWHEIVNRYPTLQDLLQKAELVAPLDSQGQPRLGWLPKISRLWSAAAADKWAMLPSTVGVVDPLHSTGIAHALSGVQRLARILLRDQKPSSSLLRSYSKNVVDEVLWIDRIVSACYSAAEHSFERFTATCSLYFVAAIHCERQLVRERLCSSTRINRDSNTRQDGFLMKDNLQLQQIVHAAELQLSDFKPTNRRNAAGHESDPFITWLREQLQPWNDVGLMDKTLFNRIARSTAVKS